jgi:prefoldin subunit 5
LREHHIQLRRRLDSVKRIHRASDELEERVAELEQAEAGVRAQIDALARELAAIDAIINQPELLPLAANG